MGGGCMAGGMHGRGRGHTWKGHVRSVLGRGHAWQGEGVCMAGGMRELCMVGGGRPAWQGGMRGRRDGHCSGRYASYWNAFLLLDITAATFFFRIKSVVDFDAGTREYPLTIQVSDGTNSIDITGTVVLNGINEHATTFGGAR